MKHYLLFFITMLSSVAALASKPAGEEVCVAQLAQGRRVEFYADDSQDAFLVLGAKGDLRLEALYKRHELRPEDRPSGSEDLVVDIERDATVSKTKHARGCYADEVVVRLRRARVDHLSRSAQNTLGLKEHQELTMKCRTETLSFNDECTTADDRALTSLR